MVRMTSILLRGNETTRRQNSTRRQAATERETKLAAREHSAAEQQPNDLATKERRDRKDFLSSSLHCNTSNSIISEKIFLAARERKERKNEDQKSLRSLRSFAANPPACGSAALGSLRSFAVILPLGFLPQSKAATPQTPSPQSKSSRQFFAAKPLIFRHFRCSAAFVSILKTRTCDD